VSLAVNLLVGTVVSLIFPHSRESTGS